MIDKKLGIELIDNWDNEKEKLIIKPLYHSIQAFLKERNKKPVYRFWFTEGNQITAEYVSSVNDCNTTSSLYWGKEDEYAEHLKKQGFENYYCFIFKVIKVEKQGEKNNDWIKEGNNIGFSYHDFPVKFELLKND